MLDGIKKVMLSQYNAWEITEIKKKKKKKGRRYANIGKSVEFLEHSSLWECKYNQFSK